MNNILIIDDNTNYSALLSWILKEHGYEVETAQTSKSGLELWLANKFDAVIVDQWLLGVEGLDVIRRARDAGLRTGVILITCLIPNDIDSKTKDLDIWAIVDKDEINGQHFLETVESAIEFTSLSQISA